jgi:hypothetical protein
MDGLVTIFSSLDPSQMDLARSMLESGGLEVFVLDRQFSGLYGSAVPMRLAVHAEDADDARAALQRFGFLE